MNMKLIDPSDPLYFHQTSDKPYDRHHYKLQFSNGRSVVFEDYEQLRDPVGLRVLVIGKTV